MVTSTAPTAKICNIWEWGKSPLSAVYPILGCRAGVGQLSLLSTGYGIREYANTRIRNTEYGIREYANMRIREYGIREYANTRIREYAIRVYAIRVHGSVQRQLAEGITEPLISLLPYIRI